MARRQRRCSCAPPSATRRHGAATAAAAATAGGGRRRRGGSGRRRQRKGRRRRGGVGGLHRAAAERRRGEERRRVELIVDRLRRRGAQIRLGAQIVQPAAERRVVERAARRARAERSEVAAARRRPARPAERSRCRPARHDDLARAAIWGRATPAARAAPPARASPPARGRSCSGVCRSAAAAELARRHTTGGGIAACRRTASWILASMASSLGPFFIFLAISGDEGEVRARMDSPPTAFRLCTVLWDLWANNFCRREAEKNRRRRRLMPHYMHVAPDEETAMRLGQLPRNPRWALNLFACVAILGAANARARVTTCSSTGPPRRATSPNGSARRAAAAF